MYKQKFLTALKMKLSGLPKQEVEEGLAFYSEMIDDRIEEGQTEEDAVLGVGSVDDIAAQIIANTPFLKIAKERMKPNRRIKAWEIVLLVLGSPIWLSLAIAAFAVVLSLYVVLWSLLISLWAVFVSLAVCGAVGIVAGIGMIYWSNGIARLFIIGAGLICAGLAIFLFFGCRAATKGIVWLSKKFVLGIKKCFIRKESNNE